MTNTTGNDEEARQTEIRPEDDQCRDKARTQGLGKPQSASSQSGNDPHGTDHPNIQSPKSTRLTSISKGEISGGILSQLILETQEELAYLEQKLPRLRSRLSCLQQLYRDLQQKTSEDFDEEDEVSDRMDNASDDEQ